MNCIYCIVLNELYSISIIEEFGKVSGMYLNISKCEGLWVGNKSHKQKNCKSCNIKWPQDPIRCLGIFIGHDEKQCFQLNWRKKIDDMERVLDSWNKRNLTYFGKIQVIKSLAISKIIYAATMTCTPSPGIIKKINTLLFKFLWGSTDKIKRNVLINEIENGGLNMIDIESQFNAIKAAWVPRILKCKTQNWCNIPIYYLQKYGDDFNLLKSNLINIKSSPYLLTLPLFYQQVILSYCNSNIIDQQIFRSTIFDQPLFGNRYFTFNFKNSCQTIYFSNWIKSGVKTLKDILIENGKINIEFLYRKINNTQNIISEISRLQKCLAPYNDIIRNNIPNDNTVTDTPLYNINDQVVDNILSKKSIFFYENIKHTKKEIPKSQDRWVAILKIPISNFNQIYTIKVKNIKDYKLAETNFKILHYILPCAANLVNWKKSLSNKCSVCNEVETIEHLLFHCNYAQHIWKNISLPSRN